ncbi:ABC transporter substrate-binding protein [Curvivirga sp.]|uniref:ABC transporter substrate-binding protein n=1 Tax=Curvivirga sp. TaxID=2856848 RepID=UPI003B59F3C8
MRNFFQRLAAPVVAGMVSLTALTGTSFAEQWEKTVVLAEGQKVYWNAWGGSETYNNYINWVADRVEEDYGIELIHVKLTDTADAVRRVLAEKSAGRDENGSIDLIWINGENFRQMKENGLLFGPFVENLPNFKLIDTDEKPSTILDFTLPTDGYESPWGMAQLIFIHDQARVPNPPKSMSAFMEYAKANPGRVTYPALPDFTGTTFMKQVLYEVSDNPSRLLADAGSEFDQETEKLWAWLDEIRPYLWREGKQFPKNGAEMIQLLDDGEIDFAYSFNVGSASNAIQEGKLPETARSFVMENGTIGNTHFVAIPYNSAHKQAAQVVANFLMSPEAQARKQNPEYWGEITVLSMSLLDEDSKARFNNIPRHEATLSNDELGKSLSEPHSSWMTMIEAEWLSKFGS